MMKVAIPIWNSRISPLLDTARHLLIVEIENGLEFSRSEVELEDYFLPRRARRFVELDIKILICGAISRQLAAMLVGSGITVVPWMSGLIDDVLQAYLKGKLPDSRFLMPGCPRRGPRGRFHGGRRPWWVWEGKL